MSATRDRSWPPRQEVDDARLVDLVADRAHVIAVRNIKHLGPRNDLPERRGEPAISSVVPTAIRTGTPMPAASSAVINRREPRRQAASARRSERV